MIHFRSFLDSNQIKAKKDQNFFLQIWKMKDFSIAGKITVFKTLAISKIVHLALVKTISNSIIQELNKVQKNLCGKLAMLK